jgi:hypothetical protein
MSRQSQLPRLKFSCTIKNENSSLSISPAALFVILQMGALTILKPHLLLYSLSTPQEDTFEIV